MEGENYWTDKMLFVWRVSVSSSVMVHSEVDANLVSIYIGELEQDGSNIGRIFDFKNSFRRVGTYLGCEEK